MEFIMNTMYDDLVDMSHNEWTAVNMVMEPRRQLLE